MGMFFLMWSFDILYEVNLCDVDLLVKIFFCFEGGMIEEYKGFCFGNIEKLLDIRVLICLLWLVVKIEMFFIMKLFNELLCYIVKCYL